MTIRQIRPKTNPTNSPAEANRTASPQSRDCIFVGGAAIKVKKRSDARITFVNGQSVHPKSVLFDRLTEDEAMKIEQDFDHIKEKYYNAYDRLVSRWRRLLGKVQ